MERKRSIFSKKKSKKDKKSKKQDKLFKSGSGGGRAQQPQPQQPPPSSTTRSVQCPKCRTHLKIPNGSIRFLCGQCNTPLSMAELPPDLPGSSNYGQRRQPGIGRQLGGGSGGIGPSRNARGKLSAASPRSSGAPKPPPPSSTDLMPAFENRRAPTTAEDWKMEETRSAIAAATRALATVSDVRTRSHITCCVCAVGLSVSGWVGEL